MVLLKDYLEKVRRCLFDLALDSLIFSSSIYLFLSVSIVYSLNRDLSDPF